MNDQSPKLVIRIKLVDLNSTSNAPRTQPSRVSGTHVSALVGASDRLPRFQPVRIESAVPVDRPLGEICSHNGRTVRHGDFENHIEKCVVCGNRVELQLDFIETLELAMYQRRAQPESAKVRGALLISAPKLNFAVCGEIDL